MKNTNGQMEPQKQNKHNHHNSQLLQYIKQTVFTFPVNQTNFDKTYLIQLQQNIKEEPTKKIKVSDFINYLEKQSNQSQKCPYERKQELFECLKRFQSQNLVYIDPSIKYQTVIELLKKKIIIDHQIQVFLAEEQDNIGISSRQRNKKYNKLDSRMRIIYDEIQKMIWKQSNSKLANQQQLLQQNKKISNSIDYDKSQQCQSTTNNNKQINLNNKITDTSSQSVQKNQAKRVIEAQSQQNLVQINATQNQQQIQTSVFRKMENLNLQVTPLFIQHQIKSKMDHSEKKYKLQLKRQLLDLQNTFQEHQCKSEKIQIQQVQDQIKLNFYQSQVFQLIQLIQNTLKVSQKTHQKDVVFLLGKTGSGKSTMVHFLSGIGIKDIAERHVYPIFPHIPQLIFENYLPGFTVGHSQASMTKQVNILETKNFIIVGTAGLSNTNGPKHDISNAIGLQKAFHNSSSVRMVFLIKQASIFGNQRGKTLIKLVRQLVGYVKNIKMQQFIPTVTVIISHPVYSSSDLHKRLKQIESAELQNSTIQDTRQRQGVLKFLKSMIFGAQIEQKKQKITMMKKQLNKIEQQIQAIQNKIKNEDLEGQQKRIKQYQDDLLQMKDEQKIKEQKLYIQKLTIRYQQHKKRLQKYYDQLSQKKFQQQIERQFITNEQNILQLTIQCNRLKFSLLNNFESFSPNRLTQKFQSEDLIKQLKRSEKISNPSQAFKISIKTNQYIKKIIYYIKTCLKNFLSQKKYKKALIFFSTIHFLGTYINCQQVKQSQNECQKYVTEHMQQQREKFNQLINGSLSQKSFFMQQSIQYELDMIKKYLLNKCKFESIMIIKLPQQILQQIVHDLIQFKNWVKILPTIQNDVDKYFEDTLKSVRQNKQAKVIASKLQTIIKNINEAQKTTLCEQIMKNNQNSLQIQLYHILFQGDQIQQIEKKSISSYDINLLSRTLQLTNQQALLKKDPVYGQYVKIQYHYYKNFLAIDFYRQGITQIIVPALRSDLMLQLEYLSLGGIPIKAEGLQQLLKVQRPCLIALEVYCCQIQTLMNSNLQNQQNLEILNLSFNPFQQDTIDQLTKYIYLKIQILKISFESFELWQEFSKFIKYSFPCLQQLCVRSDNYQLPKKFNDKNIFKGIIDDINYGFQRPPGISYGYVDKYDDDIILNNKFDNNLKSQKIKKENLYPNQSFINQKKTKIQMSFELSVEFKKNYFY